MSDTPDHRDEYVTWRPGVDTRMRISEVNGARELCVFDQRVAPGAGTPIHTHTVEEVLSVKAGTAEIILGPSRQVAKPGDVALIPAGVPHGFVNIGDTDLIVTAILAAPIFQATFGENQFVRRWSVADEGSTVVSTVSSHPSVSAGLPSDETTCLEFRPLHS